MNAKKEEKSFYLDLDSDSSTTLDLTDKPKKKRERKVKKKDDEKNNKDSDKKKGKLKRMKLHFDKKLNLYYENSYVGSFVLNKKYENLSGLFVEKGKFNCELHDEHEAEEETAITNQDILIDKLLDNDHHCFQNVTNTPQRQLINKNISHIVYNKEFHKNDFTFGKSRTIDRDLKFYHEQIKHLKKLPQPEQRTPPWYELRVNRLTASELADALGEGHFKTSDDVILQKCGLGPVFNGNAITEWGVKYEAVAISIYEKRTKSSIYEYGLVPHSTIPFLGASPDGISEDGIMLEIKCPPKRKILGIVPHHYWVQMQLQLEVCDLEMCDFEECKLVEYKEDESYYVDNAEDDETMTATNMEKGVSIEYFDKNEQKLKYIYCDLGLKHSKTRKWVDINLSKLEAKDNLSKIRVAYWYLDTYSVTRVYRNRDWFAKKFPIMKEFWSKVCFYRNVGCDELLNDLRSKRKEKYEISDDEEHLNKEDVVNKDDISEHHFATDDSDIDFFSEFDD